MAQINSSKSSFTESCLEIVGDFKDIGVGINLFSEWK